jgi:RNA polymerase sigma-70 factor (ECF subfamily)
VKVRLHRARAMLRKKLFTLAGSGLHSAFAFDGERCDRIVARTMARIAQTAIK